MKPYLEIDIKTLIYVALYKLRIHHFLRTEKNDSLSVLCLHRVSDKRDSFFDPISPRNFEMLIKYLMKNYHLTTFEELNNTVSNKPKMILSFDDGYKDFIENALPILSKYKIPSNHNFVNTCLNTGEPIWTQRLNNIFTTLEKRKFVDYSFIENFLNIKVDSNSSTVEINQQIFTNLLDFTFNDKLNFLFDLENQFQTKCEDEMMDWNDLIQVHNSGLVEIGSHSYNHDSLSSICDYNEEKKNIEASINELSSKIKKQIQVLSLPNGFSSENTSEIANTLGIKYLLKVNDNRNKIMRYEDDKIYCFDRIYLINESIESTILRTELFHSKIKSFYA